MADDDGLMDFINELQHQEETQAATGGDANAGMMDRIRRASAAALSKKGVTTTEATEELRLSKIGAGANDAYNEINQFANTAANVDNKLTALQMRHLQAEYLWGYEAERRDKTETMGQEVMKLKKNFEKRVTIGIAELESLSGYLKARGAAERSYAAAIRRSTELLNSAGDDARVLFQDLDMNICFQVEEFASTLDQSLPEDVQHLLNELYEFAGRARPAINELHREFLRSERHVREEHRNLVKAFNGMLDHLRTNASSLVGSANGPKSSLDPASDPWLAEQAYRMALMAANRHSEFYIKELGRLEDELIILGQKRAVVVMCSKKIVLFETVKLHTETSQKLEFISKSVSGNKELLEGEKTVDDASSSMTDNVNYDAPISLTGEQSTGAVSSDGDGGSGTQSVVAANEFKYPFQMPLPPAGTNAYEQDLSYIVRDVPESETTAAQGPGGEFLAKEVRKAEVEKACADVSAWKSVRAVLTNERILHLYSNDPADMAHNSEMVAGTHGGAVTLLPFKSINCRRHGTIMDGIGGGGEGASIRRSYYAGQASDEEDDEEDDSSAARCFEIVVKATSLLKSFNPFANKNKTSNEHFLFQAEDKRSLEIWLAILRDDSVNLGDPIAIATCVDTPRDNSVSSDEEADVSQDDSLSAEAMEALMKMAELPEIEERRQSIFRAAAHSDEEASEDEEGD